MCWLSGMLFGFLPLLGWHCNEWDGKNCFFEIVTNKDYLLLFVLIELFTPFLILIFTYGLICFMLYRSSKNSSVLKNNEGVLQWEVTKNVSIIVAIFVICWLPLGVIDACNFHVDNCFTNVDVINFAVAFSHFGAAINPMIYAYRIREIRDALKKLLNIKKIEQHEGTRVTSD